MGLILSFFYLSLLSEELSWKSIVIIIVMLLCRKESFFSEISAQAT